MTLRIADFRHITFDLDISSGKSQSFIRTFHFHFHFFNNNHLTARPLPTSHQHQTNIHLRYTSVTMSGRTYLQVPSMNMDGPSDTRSQGSDHRSSHGGSQSGRSQHGGSQAGSTHSHSHVGSQAGSRPPSEAGPAPSQTTRAYPAPLGYDPGREKKPDDDRPNPRYDLPPEAFMPVSTHLLMPHCSLRLT